MTIIETYADKLVALVEESKNINTKNAAKTLAVPEKYIRLLATTLQQSNILSVRTTTVAMVLSPYKEDKEELLPAEQLTS